MQSDDDRNTPRLPNIFLRELLDLLGRRDEPPAAAEAAVAGPWHIEEVHATFYAIYRSRLSRASLSRAQHLVSSGASSYL